MCLKKENNQKEELSEEMKRIVAKYTTGFWDWFLSPKKDDPKEDENLIGTEKKGEI